MKLKMWRDLMVDGRKVDDLDDMTDDEYMRHYLGSLKASIEFRIPAWMARVYVLYLKGRISNGDR